MSTDGGSNYNVTKTTTSFRALNAESGAYSELTYILQVIWHKEQDFKI
jgi:hypothetical protein